jgi:hypothetical protein
MTLVVGAIHMQRIAGRAAVVPFVVRGANVEGQPFVFSGEWHPEVGRLAAC